MNSSRHIASASEGLIDNFLAGRLNVYVYETAHEVGIAAASTLAAEIRRLITKRGRAIGIFTAAHSQIEFLDELVKAEAIEWTRVIGFHPNEYLGLDEDAPQSSRKFLLNRLVRQVPMAEFHGIRGEAANPEAVCANYGALLKSRSPDFATLEIGDNGSLASIGPSTCNFNDPALVKVVELEETSRQQMVREGVFARFEEVPRRAISLTIPAVMCCPELFVIAPGEGKQQAVLSALEGGVSEACPASILTTHLNAHLFLDRESAAELPRFT